MSNLNKLTIEELKINPFTLIGKNWFLLTCGNKTKYNSMTCSWGQMGHLWNKNIFTVYVRHSRYTHEFIENNEYFTVSFFKNEYKKLLSILGTKSGREINKMDFKELTPYFVEDNIVAYEEAQYTFVCKKIHKSFLNTDKLNVINKTFYENNDFHDIFIGEIMFILTNENGGK